MSKPECVFDAIIAGSAPADMVLDEAEVVAFLDVRPLFPGHTLVVSRRHHETVAELPVTTGGLMWEAAGRVATAQRSAFGAEGTFFALNDVVSQSVPHAHLHVVPRRRKDGLRGFFWPRRRYKDASESAETAAKLREALAKPASASERPQQTVDVAVREAQPEDAARLAEIVAGGSLRGGEDPSDPAPYRAALVEIAATEGNQVLVAVADGSVVGVCQLIFFRHFQERGGRCAEIESVHVAAEHRGRGVGSALAAAAIEAARRAGCYRVQLTSHKTRLDAHRFWVRQGFVASHEGFKLYL